MRGVTERPSVEGSDGFCPYCGTSNPPSFNFFEKCHRPLPGTHVEDDLEAPTPPLDLSSVDSPRRIDRSTTINVGRGTAGLVFVYIGIPLVVMGILLLAIASVTAGAAASFNQTCSTNPTCQAQPAPANPSDAFAGAGALVLILGILLAGYGFVQYARIPN
jgi:hypothetical protein